MVQLNSGTQLKFPVVFDKEKREVYLTGALFEVQKDEKRPFYVIAERNQNPGVWDVF